MLVFLYGPVLLLLQKIRKLPFPKRPSVPPGWTLFRRGKNEKSPTTKATADFYVRIYTDSFCKNNPFLSLHTEKRNAYRKGGEREGKIAQFAKISPTVFESLYTKRTASGKISFYQIRTFLFSRWQKKGSVCMSACVYVVCLYASTIDGCCPKLCIRCTIECILILPSIFHPPGTEKGKCLGSCKVV
jgi:hypothetical protein